MKAAVLKTVVGFCPPRVRISASPPSVYVKYLSYLTAPDLFGLRQAALLRRSVVEFLRLASQKLIYEKKESVTCLRGRGTEAAIPDRSRKPWALRGT